MKIFAISMFALLLFAIILMLFIRFDIDVSALSSFMISENII